MKTKMLRAATRNPKMAPLVLYFIKAAKMEVMTTTVESVVSKVIITKKYSVNKSRAFPTWRKVF